MVTKKDVLKKLSEVMDPELGVNIVDMGFIYKIEKKKTKNKKEQFYIEMTYTTPACPLMGFIEDQIRNKLSELNADFDIRVVFDPPWTPARISKDARKKLGI
jgi:metal-sulfur cluster biosynthetic enzyme